MTRRTKSTGKGRKVVTVKKKTTGEVSTGEQITNIEQSDIEQAEGNEKLTVEISAAAGDEEATVKRAGEISNTEAAGDELSVKPATDAGKSVTEQVGDVQVTVEDATVTEQMDQADGNELDTREQTADGDQVMTEQATSNEVIVEKSMDEDTEHTTTSEKAIDEGCAGGVSTVGHADLTTTKDAGEQSTSMEEESDTDLTTNGAAATTLTNLAGTVDRENAATNQANGYDANFIDDIPDYLTCGICYLVLTNPVHLVDCGHRLCQLCFQNLKTTSSQANIDLLCPHDKIKLNPNKVFQDKGMSRGIMDLKVKCTNYDLGCQWIGKLQHLEDHTGNYCSFMDGQGMFAVFNQLQKKLEHFEKGMAETGKEISIMKKQGEQEKYAEDQINWLEKQGEKCKQSEERLSFLLEKQVVQGMQSQERISLLEKQLKQCVKTEEEISSLKKQLELCKKAEEQVSTLEKKIEQSGISCENGILAMEKHVKQCKQSKEQMHSTEKQVERRVHALEKEVKQVKRTDFEERIYTIERSMQESKQAETARNNERVLLKEREGKFIDQRLSFLEKQTGQSNKADEKISALGKEIELCRKSVEDVSFMTKEIQQHRVSDERMCNLEGQIKQLQKQISANGTEAQQGEEKIGEYSSEGIGNPKQAVKRPAKQLPLPGDNTSPKSAKLAKSDTQGTPLHQDMAQSFQQGIILKAFALNKQRVDKIDKQVTSLEEQIKTLHVEMLTRKRFVSQDIKPAATVTKAITVTTSFPAAVDRGLLISRNKFVPDVKHESTPEQLPAIDYGQCATAVCDYEASDAEEITLRPGNTVTQIEQLDEDWWRGMGPNRKYGLFPASYVTLIN